MSSLPSLFAALVVLAADSGLAIDFARDVAPIFERSCVRCHHPDDRKGDFSLTRRSDLLDSGHVVPRASQESNLMEVIRSEAGQRPKMPKEGPALDVRDIDILRRWIDQGATWPNGLTLKTREKADRHWWSLQPLAHPPIPSPEGIPPSWTTNPVDRFVFARLKDKGLSPQPPADARVLARRLSFDLTGLPPNPKTLERFARDHSPKAYERLVDELLSSPAYGEHWGRHWLDVTRFGESNGFERNVLIPNLWPFRDYVIKSFNDDKPFDRFILEHLAGDAVGPGELDSEVGTAFLVCGPYDNVGNQDADQAAIIRANTLDDMIRATGEAFLGVTIGCARCHDHKFDPITQADYYRLYATFAGVAHGDRAVEALSERRAREARALSLSGRRALLQAELASMERRPTPAIEERLPIVLAELLEIDEERSQSPPPPTKWWLGQFQPADGPFHVFQGGDPRKKGDVVIAASLSFLDSAAKPFRLNERAPEQERRLALAQWLVSPGNPLSKRVLANRIWQHHFGVGIVDTPSDFGWMGGRPSHPELLDWLAEQIARDGWRLKPIHRLLVTSQTYRQASTWNPRAAAIDSDSRLLWRFPPRRLSAEEIRDAMLLVSGLLDPRPGGPGFRLYRYVEDNVATYIPLDDPGPETFRRSVYHQNARAARVDVLSDFDCPDPAFASPRRSSTTTPLQSLTMLNHRFTLRAAESMASRLEKEEKDVDRRLELAYQWTFSRAPTAEERRSAKELTAQHGWRALCRGLLNSNEFLYVD